MEKRQLSTIMLVLRNENVGGLVRCSISERGPAHRNFSEGVPVYRSLCEGGFTDLFILIIRII